MADIKTVETIARSSFITFRKRVQVANTLTASLKQYAILAILYIVYIGVFHIKFARFLLSIGLPGLLLAIIHCVVLFTVYKAIVSTIVLWDLKSSEVESIWNRLEALKTQVPKSSSIKVTYSHVQETTQQL